MRTQRFWRRWLLAAIGLLGGFFGASSSQAQQTHAVGSSPSDSSQLSTVQVLPDVRVQAARPGRFAVGSRLTTIDSLALTQYRTGTLTDVLAARTPLFIKNYGPGQLSSITIRGTSARHTAVLWNGFNINLPSLGEADFALLPAGGNTRVDVQHGPAGATYGTGAVGGTVLLSSPIRWGAGTQVSAQLDAGQYGLEAGSLEGRFSNQKVAVRTAASYREARNDFPYNSPEITGLVRRRQQNAAVRQWSLSQDATLRLGEHGELMAAIWLTDADRQLQPAIGSGNNHAREQDQSRRLLAGYRHVASGRHESAVRVAWFEDVIDYQNDDLTSNSRVRTTQAQAEHTVTFNSKASLRIGGEAQHFAAEVDGYGKPVSENRFSGFGLLRYDPVPRLQLTANLRQAFISGRRPPLAPTVGAEWQFWQTPVQQVSLKVSASRSYRAPTLNERFWRTGDPNLRPENGIGYEAGLRHQFTKNAPWNLQTELTAYHQLVNDWVQWLPNTQGDYTPRNLRQVRARGLEASSQLTGHWGAYSLVARAAYGFTESEKVEGRAEDPDPSGRQLPYVPLHSFAFTTDQSWHKWQLTTGLTFTGYRYTDASAVDFLPSYTLLNASLGRTLAIAPNWAVTVLAQGFNLTNRDYQVYAYRAMPPRNAALSLRLTWR
ncbi:TonB-dependent receptor [Hymenobacter sp. BT188]|uniref:TonB-dependent receptor n=1 Tax=Hymenobacter sp. BT188 TaxID=2763504 RepID=UPI001650EFD5|nr:TonB-dependent receptor [Hymenobacter sp. BT188]MBC6606277.1 TonB-dependent receptor [Hymenobacter sp. BT188]